MCIALRVIVQGFRSGFRSGLDGLTPNFRPRNGRRSTQRSVAELRAQPGVEGAKIGSPLGDGGSCRLGAPLSSLVLSV
jgi:hypothetical protein